MLSKVIVPPIFLRIFRNFRGRRAQYFRAQITRGHSVKRDGSLTGVTERWIRDRFRDVSKLKAGTVRQGNPIGTAHRHYRIQLR